MTIEILIIGTLFVVCMVLTAKALYHRNRVLKILDTFDADALTMRANAGLTMRYEQVQDGQRFSSN